MDEPESGPASSERPAAPVLDDDVATEDVVAEDPEVDPEAADLDRTEQEGGAVRRTGGDRRGVGDARRARVTGSLAA